MLANIGRLLIGCLRLGDVAARVGGEEFLVLVPDTDMAGSIAVAEKIRVAVRDSRSPGLAHNTTVSVGVACSADGTEPGAALLRRADLALYDGKRRGRDLTVGAPAPPLSGPEPAGPAGRRGRPPGRVAPGGYTEQDWGGRSSA